MRRDGGEGADEREPRWGTLRTSPRAFAIVGLIAVSLAGGLFLAQPLIFVSVPLTMVLVFTVLLARDPRARVEVERVTESMRVNEGERTRVKLRVRNVDERKGIPMLQIFDRVPPELAHKGTRSAFTTSLRAGETKELHYEVRGNTFGIFAIGPVTLRAQDATGFFEAESQLSSYSKLAVFPEATERVGPIALRPLKTRSWPGEIVSRRSGAGMDYYNIRPFAAGDPLKRVNWRASARYAQGPGDGLLVNEYNAEVGADVLLVVDPGRRTLTRSGELTTSLLAVRAAIPIAERLLHDRNRVGLLTMGSKARRIPAGYGRRQFDRITLALLELRPAEADMEWWVDCSIHMFFPSITQVVFVSSLMDVESRRTIAGLVRSGDRDIVVLSPDPVGPAESAAKGKNWRERRVAARLAALERTLEVQRLRAAGALVIDWSSHTSSLEEVLEVHRAVISRHASSRAARSWASR